MFVEKLNKKQEGVYVIEEEKTVIDGIWEGYLNHDNVNHETIYIYTGPKLSGEKVENYFISTPSETPWKTHLKVFSESEKIYITYETTGDQVEAEDINLVQDEIVNEIERAITEETRIETKLDNEIVRAITEDEKLNEDVEELREKKADKVYVDTELNKVYKKDEVFTKEEVLQKIEEIIDAAPEALDTLGKLAKALDNDPNFATNIINLLATKVDKVAGKGLSTEDYTTEEKQKLAGIEDGANKYVHPNTHPASMIVETSSKKFVSDVEKANWNDANSKKHIHNNKSVLDKITQTLVDAWNSAVEHINDSVRHITSAERAKWNAKAEKSDIPTKVGQLKNDKGYVTQEELSNAGYGDMTKAEYDKNGDGVVDKAEVANGVDWSKVDEIHLTGSIFDTNLKADNWNLINKYTGGGWARGLLNVKDKDGKNYIQIGANGGGQNFSKLYIGKAWDDWQLGIYPNTNTIKIKGNLTKNGIEVADKADIPTKLSELKGPLTWNDLKGV